MNQLNLIPSHVKQKKIRRLTIIHWAITIVLITAALGVGAYLPQLWLKNLQREEAHLLESTAREQIAKVENEKLKGELALLKGFTDIVDVIKNDKTQVEPLIRRLQVHFPADVVLSNMSYSNGSINITASAGEYASVYELLANLQESAEYKNSTVSSLTNTENNRWDFSLNIMEVEVAQNE
jgi:Tfp pilus assembly protein PilN